MGNQQLFWESETPEFRWDGAYPEVVGERELGWELCLLLQVA